MPVHDFVGNQNANQLLTSQALMKARRTQSFLWETIPMMRPNVTSATVDVPASGFGLGSAQKGDGGEDATYRKHGMDAGGVRDELDFGLISFKFHTRTEGLAKTLPSRDIRVQEEHLAWNLMQKHGQNLMGAAFVGMEQFVSALFQSVTLNGTGAVTSQWNAAGGTFFSDVRTQSRTIQLNYGVPRAMQSLIIPRVDADRLASSQDFLDVLYGTNENGQRTTDQVISDAVTQCGLAGFKIGEAVGRTSDEGQATKVNAYVWTTASVFLGYVPWTDMPGLAGDDPEEGAHFLVEEQSPFVGNYDNGEQGFARAEKVYVDYAYDRATPLEKSATASNRSYVFTAATA